MRRLILADYSFRQSSEALKFISINKPNLPPQLVEITLNGACVTYCRPFTKSDFYGCLGATFTKFPGRLDYQQLHDNLWNGRNWIAAHSEPERAAKLFGGQPSDLTEIGILFKKPHGMIAFVNEPIFSFDHIELFMALCEFQSVRVLEKFKSLLHTAFKSKPQFNHRYRIGADLPQ